MKEIRDNLNELKKELESSNEDKHISKLVSIIDLLTDKIEEVLVNQEAMEENIKFMDTDISGIQEEIFEELSFEDLEDMEDEYEEVDCVHCSKPIFIEKSVVNKKEEIKCPYCKENIFK